MQFELQGKEACCFFHKDKKIKMADEITALKDEIIEKVIRMQSEFSEARLCSQTLRTMSANLDTLGFGDPPVDFLSMDVREFFTPAQYQTDPAPDALPRFNITREHDTSGKYQAYLGVNPDPSDTVNTRESLAATSLVRLLHESETGYGHFTVYLIDLHQTQDTYPGGHPVVRFEIHNYMGAGDGRPSNMFLSAKRGLQNVMGCTSNRTDPSTKFILSGTFGRCKINVWQPTVDPSIQFTQKAVRANGLLVPRTSGTPNIIHSTGSATDPPDLVAYQDWRMEYVGTNPNHPLPRG